MIQTSGFSIESLLRGLLGIASLLLIAFAFSRNRKGIGFPDREENQPEIMQNGGSINIRLSKLENDKRRNLYLEAKRSKFRDEKATITSTVDLAGNRPLEEMRDSSKQIGRISRWNNFSDPRESSGNRSDKPVRRRNRKEQPEWPLRPFGREKGRVEPPNGHSVYAGCAR